MIRTVTRRTSFAHAAPRGFPTLLIIAGILLVIGATPVSAGHDAPGHGSVIACPVDGCNQGCGMRHRYERREYERGLDLGLGEGESRGYRDGLYRRPFCDRPYRRLRRFSLYFAEGYLDAYPEGYAEGYQRARERSPWRWRGRGRGRWSR